MKFTEEKIVISGQDIVRCGGVIKAGTLAKAGFVEAEIANYSVKIEVSPLLMGHDYTDDTKALDAFLDEYHELLKRYGVEFSAPLST